MRRARFLASNPHLPQENPCDPLFPTVKRQGEWAELAFMTKAARMGWNVARIFGDSTPYDIIIERDGLMLRIQVKSVLTERHTAYQSSPAASANTEPRHTR